MSELSLHIVTLHQPHIHAGGASVKESFENVCCQTFFFASSAVLRLYLLQATIAMFGYMTDLETVDIDTSKSVEVEVEGMHVSTSNMSS